MTLPATFASITNPTTSTSLLNQSLYSFEGTVAMSDVNQSIATSNDPQDIRIENSDEYVDIDIILKSSSSNQSAPPATDYFPSTPSVSCDEGDSTKPRHRTSSSVDDRKCNQDRLNATCRNPPSHVLEHTRAKIESDACLQFGKLKPTVLEDGSIKCAFLGCPRTFENTGLLRSHMVVHVDGKPYSCEMCHGLKRYKRNHDLLRHQREVHFENDEAHVNDRDGEEDMVGYFATSAGSSLSALTAPRRSHPYSRAHYSQLEEEAEQTPADRKISSHNQKYRRKQLRTRVEQRVIWNGRQMENIDVELVRSRGRPRVRPLKRTEATVNEFSLIPPGPRPFSCEDARIVNLGRDDYHSSAAAVVTAATGGLLSTTRTAYSSTSASLGLVSSQSADSAQRLQDWLRIEANSTARWGSHSAQLMPQVASRPPSFQHLQGYYSPHHSQDNIHLAMAAAANAAAAPSLQSPLTVNGNEREQHQSNRDRIRREDEELIRLGRWRQINARVAERHRQRT
ncbi:hypothetical protein BG004_006629 [Podila humilis]|nr:hypothetical protein BG004_006629 [Podila humilis]